MAPQPFVDIHCHLLPGIDDGAASWAETLAMAQLAVAEGIATIVATPHQCGNFAHNDGQRVRSLVRQVQIYLNEHMVPLTVLAGGDVRIEEGLLAGLLSGEVLTLGDHRRHVLLELPHELYLPLEDLLETLQDHNIVGILSHPERNEGIRANPRVLAALVEAGCLMQITAGSLTGAFGSSVAQLSRRLVRSGLVHVVATDAHGSERRPSCMLPAFRVVVEEVGWDLATELCCTNPAQIAAGLEVAPGRRHVQKPSFAARLQSKLSRLLSSGTHPAENCC